MEFVSIFVSTNLSMFQKAKEEKEVIDNTKLTRELMEKYIDSVFCEGNEVLNIIWK